jgi:hypothetical protein
LVLFFRVGWVWFLVAFFFLQWGGRAPKTGGNALDGRQWLEFPDSLEVGRSLRSS